MPQQTNTPSGDVIDLVALEFQAAGIARGHFEQAVARLIEELRTERARRAEAEAKLLSGASDRSDCTVG
jgi:hypothetical protein